MLNGKLVFTLKKQLSNDLAAYEKELVFEDSDTMTEILSLLDFVDFVNVSKVRRKLKYNDWTICLDKVEKLGDFIEVESLGCEDVEKTQEELFLFLESLGINREDRVEVGYDVLMYRLEK